MQTAIGFNGHIQEGNFPSTQNNRMYRSRIYLKHEGKVRKMLKNNVTNSLNIYSSMTDSADEDCHMDKSSRTSTQSRP